VCWLRTLMSLAKRGRRSANKAVVVVFSVAPELAPAATYTMWFGVAVSTCGAMSTVVRLVGNTCVLHMTTLRQLRCSLLGFGDK
jgi:hypothetical protein